MGSTTHIVDGTRKVQNHYEYDAWGNITAQEEAIPKRFTYYDQQFDPITQRYYLHARFYNPVIARFTQEDTYRGDGLNLYAYCANNPVCYADPSGHECSKGDSLTRAQEQNIAKLRAGQTISVKSVEDARALLHTMPEIQPPPLGRINPEFPDLKGAYRGDLINIKNPMADYVHDPKVVQQNPLHAIYPHYNIYFLNGTKAATLITG